MLLAEARSRWGGGKRDAAPATQRSICIALLSRGILCLRSMGIT